MILAGPEQGDRPGSTGGGTAAGTVPGTASPRVPEQSAESALAAGDRASQRER